MQPLQVMLLRITLTIFLTTLVATEMYFDINSYIRFNQGKNLLEGAERRISFRFRYCNDKGVLFYQSGQDGYFALGVSSKKIYIEWKTSNIVVELYIGNGNLEQNVTNSVVIDNLSDRRSTIAYVNGMTEKVEYLIILDEELNFNKLSGQMSIGGFVDVSLLPMNTERLSAYLTTCIDYIDTAVARINLTSYDFAVGVYMSCPQDFCAPSSVLTTTSSTSFVRMNVTVKSRTQTQISFWFRTEASQGLLFYIGGPAYLTLFLTDAGRLGLGLNTRGTEPGAYNYSSLGGFNDGSWKYVQVTRSNNVANVTNDSGYLLTSTRFGDTDESGFNMNSEAIYMAGSSNRLSFLPAEAQTSTIGCFKAPRFVSYSIASEPASLLSYQTQVQRTKDIKMDGCFSTETCVSNPCPSPSQTCNFRCKCAEGFYTFTQTPLRCVNVNDCASTPCQNNGSCVDLVLDYRCQCLPRFKGKDCSQLNYCFNNPCLNGAACNDNDNSFTCNCTSGFSGSACQTDLDECLQRPCRNGATCVNEPGSFSCRCTSGYSGTLCEADVDECLGNPCLNGGRCQNDVGSFRCQCANGWAGPTCTQDIDECSSNPCVNGATCINDIGSYRCSCEAGFTGPNCQSDINECAVSPCRNGGVCNDGRNAYTCSCLPGFNGNNCEVDINECLSQPCRNGGVCVDEVNRFSCRCSAGYAGTFCETNIDECASNPCLNGARCEDNVSMFTCICLPGYFGSRCEQMINRCSPDPCSNAATCINNVNSFTCQCTPGFTGFTCDVNIDDCNPLPCLNGAICEDLINSYRCNCPPGYQGNICADDVDECTATNRNPCSNGGTCSNLIGRFSCQCVAGFAGATCGEDINECASSPCLNGGTCQDRVNSFQCQCQAGFNGERCQLNINECLSDPCQNSAVCVDQVNSYRCECTAGYSGSNCDVEVNECLSNPCRNTGVCDDMVGRFRCICATGYEGTLCEQDINDCLINRCANAATCVDGVNQYRCNCLPGWTGQFCEQNINDCSPNPCANSATCTDLVNSFRCNCPSGFEGPSCSHDINECNLNLCVNHVTCVNTLGSFTCTCKPGFTGQRCENLSNQCLSQPCYFDGTCVNLANGVYTCQCKSDYMGNRCEAVIRFCNFTSPCAAHAMCTDVELGGYKCLCKPGYTGLNCQQEVNECNSNPCFNGGTCFDLVNQYRCLCQAGYTGSNCVLNINECASNPCQNEGLCSEPSANMYQCSCRPGYEGVNCEKMVDNCQRRPCQHNQICTNTLNSFLCSCLDGFQGDQCSVRTDKCVSEPCQNGGICTSIPGGSFSCFCPPPFSGSTCDVSDDACVHNPCLHMGLCVRDLQLAEGFRCDCKEGFIGTRCQGDVRECLSNPCQNGASCLEMEGDVSGYTCQCLPTFAGINCDQPSTTLAPSNPCANFPCLNQGTCFPITATLYRCSCLNGWTGSTCGSNVNECVPISPCLNGGQCRDNTGSYVCECVNGWSGFQCNLPPADPCSLNPCPGQICKEVDGGLHVCCALGSTFCPNPCSTTPCLNAGTCTPLSTSTYNCQCSPGTQGNRCEIVLMATFQGNNYVQIPYSSPLRSSSFPSYSPSALPSPPSSSSIHQRTKRQNVLQVREVKSLSITFVTNIDNGLIFFATGSVQNDRREFMLFEIHEGQLRIAVGFPNQTVVNTFDISRNLFNKTFTTISIRVASGLVATSVTPCYNANNSNNICSNNNTITWDSLRLGGQLFFGAVPTWTNYLRSKVKSTQNFKGCLGLLKINQEEVSIINSPINLIIPLINQNATEKPIPGCQVLPACRSDYCKNGGRCVDLWFEQRCVCGASFAGRSCERQQVIHLSGSPTFGYQRLDQSEFSNSTVTFEVTSNRGSGFILYTLSTTPLGLFLENWKLTFVLWLPDVIKTTKTEVSLENRKWFGVFFNIQATFIDLIVTSVESRGVLYQARIRSEVEVGAGRLLYVGSLFQNSTSDAWRIRFPAVNASIIGCVRSLQINGNLLDMGLNNTVSWDNPRLSEITKKCPREEQCASDACGLHGSCVSGWAGHECSCYPAYSGPACSTFSMATYNGLSAYTNVTLDTRSYSFGSHLSFDMRTRQKDDACVLFVYVSSTTTQPPTSLCFLIASGLFGLVVKSGSRIDMTMMTQMQVSNGEWNSMKVHFYDDIVNITNNFNRGQYFSLDSATLTGSYAVRVLAGAGLNAANEAPNRFFKGCLRNLNLNSHSGAVSLQSDYSKLREGVSSVTTHAGVLEGCVSDDVCASRPCNASGSCNDLWNAYECQCRPGWVGDLCDQVSTTCASHLCVNFVACVNAIDGYQCQCMPGYSGTFCEQVVQPCDAVPCQNAGECANRNDGGFTCVCPNGFVGDLCEQDVDECAPNPCGPGSTCINGRGTFSCQCPPWLSGLTCNTTQFCASKPCRNNATCVQAADSFLNFTCSCTPGFSGDRCEQFNPCFSFPCENNGSCSEVGGAFNCSCLPPFLGETCESTDLCSPNHCRNGASCETIRADGMQFSKCNCLVGFYGKVCDLVDSCSTTACLSSRNCPQVDPLYTCPCTLSSTTPTCTTLPSSCDLQFTFCSPGGVCYWNETTLRPYCSCLNGFSGRYCTLQGDPCQPQPCMNGGACEALSSGAYKCVCGVGFSGSNCQSSLSDPCSSTPCQFGAQCTNSLSSPPFYVCECGAFLSGENCAVCSYCLNGGVCRLSTPSPVSPPPTSPTPPTPLPTLSCDCSSTNHTGDRCDVTIQPANPCFPNPCFTNQTCKVVGGGSFCSVEAQTNTNTLQSSKADTGMIVGLAIGLPLILLALLALYWLYRREQRLRGVYNPPQSDLYPTNQSTSKLFKPPFTISNRNNVLT